MNQVSPNTIDYTLSLTKTLSEVVNGPNTLWQQERCPINPKNTKDVKCPKTGSHVWLLVLTWCASGLLEVDVAEVQHAGYHPEEIQLLCVVQADLLHGYAHPGEVAVVVQQRVLQRARLCVLGNQERKRHRHLKIFVHLHLLHIFILMSFLTQLTSNLISLPLVIFTFPPTCSLLFLHFGEIWISKSF